MEKSNPKSSLNNLNEKDPGNKLVSILDIQEIDRKFESNLLLLEVDVRKKMSGSPEK
jgi:hypothetical protein